MEETVTVAQCAFEGSDSLPVCYMHMWRAHHAKNSPATAIVDIQVGDFFIITQIAERHATHSHTNTHVLGVCTYICTTKRARNSPLPCPHLKYTQPLNSTHLQALVPKEWVPPVARELLDWYCANAKDHLMITRYPLFQVISGGYVLRESYSPSLNALEQALCNSKGSIKAL
jgi:hypothetical protein